MIMCGRYALTTPPQVLAALFRLANIPPTVRRYNAAPTQSLPVVVEQRDGSRRLESMRWGLIPSWAKDAAIGNRLINARSESAAEKPSFRSAMKHRRCLVPISGFYEWQKQGTRKQPFYIVRADGEPMALAGLWESWVDRESGEEVKSFTILTTEASKQIKHLHDRMPVMIDPSDFGQWLNAEANDVATVQPLLTPAKDIALTLVPVSTRVNKPANDDASLIEPLKGPNPTQSRGGFSFDMLDL